MVLEVSVWMLKYKPINNVWNYMLKFLKQPFMYGVVIVVINHFMDYCIFKHISKEEKKYENIAKNRNRIILCCGLSDYLQGK